MLIVGYIDRNRTGIGKPFRNMVAILQNGKIIATYQKQLLPFYDVFDEGRYFEPGMDLCVFEIAGEKWGLAICEDVWNDKGSDDYSYNDNPLQAYRDIGIKNIISINSSPFIQEKPEQRIKMLEKSFKDGTVIYVNQVGGQDELVFDGHSFIVENGEVTHLSDMKECVDIIELGLGKKEGVTGTWNCLKMSLLTKSRAEILYHVLLTGLKDYIEKSGFKQVVFGSSGGIDSAVVAALACAAVGPENVHGIRMPSKWSSDHSKDDALLLHKNLGCHDYVVTIDHDPFVKHINSSLAVNGEYNPVADENIQARMRGNVVMHFSNAFGALPLTTGNKTELALGYCTLYGDMSGGFAPISDLYKMEVYALANHINNRIAADVDYAMMCDDEHAKIIADVNFDKHEKIIPQNIIDKAPSAELAPDQKDEDSLLPYPILDPIVRAYIEYYISEFDKFKIWAASIEAVKDFAEEDEYNRMIQKIDINEFKRRQAAPGIKVSSRAFGTGRRIPIVKASWR